MIKVVGAGPGSIKYLTLDARDAIINANYVIAFSRIGHGLEVLRADIIKVTRMLELFGVLQEIGGDKDIVILASGDPNFFGVVDLLKRNDLIISEVIPGISSVQYMFSRLQKPYSNVITKSVHGRNFDFSQLEKDKTYAFLIDSEKNANYISEVLSSNGYGGNMYAGYNLSYEQEEIFSFKVGEEIIEPSDLGVVVVEIDVD